jgi:transposase
LGRTSVRDYLARADVAGVRYEDVADAGEAEIEALLFRRPEPVETRPRPDWSEVAAELAKPAVTLLLVWREYRDRHPEGYSYSQFRRHYRSHQSLAPEPRMRRTLLPAQLCEVDYAGMVMPVMTASGERQASLFVGTLPFSTLLYAEATWTQTADDWLASHVRMFAAWGGSVPKLVPDNLKTGVTHASFYDPVLNPPIWRWRGITGSALFRLACAVHGTSLWWKMACSRSSAGCWRRCATGSSSAWTR